MNKEAIIRLAILRTLRFLRPHASDAELTVAASEIHLYSLSSQDSYTASYTREIIRTSTGMGPMETANIGNAWHYSVIVGPGDHGRKVGSHYWIMQYCPIRLTPAEAVFLWGSVDGALLDKVGLATLLAAEKARENLDLWERGS